LEKMGARIEVQPASREEKSTMPAAVAAAGQRGERSRIFRVFLSACNVADGSKQRRLLEWTV
jgi:hypothetical protein